MGHLLSQDDEALRGDLSCNVCKRLAQATDIFFKAPGTDAFGCPTAHLLRVYWCRKRFFEGCREGFDISGWKDFTFDAGCDEVALAADFIRDDNWPLSRRCGAPGRAS